MNQRGKRCFTFTKCDYESRCEHAHVPPNGDYLTPRHTGEHCDSFKPLIAPVDSDMVEKLARMAGAHD